MYWLKLERELWGTGHTQPAREEIFEPKKSINWHRDKIKEKCIMQMII